MMPINLATPRKVMSPKGTHRRQAISSQDVFSYDVSAHGQRFLIATKLDEADTAPLSVFLNWASAMKR
jgi:hypothetical protein